MKLEAIRLKNFKAFKDAELRDVPRMCVLVGANGTGKSTLFNVFGFLKDALTEDVHVALTRLGGSRGFQEARRISFEGYRYHSSADYDATVESARAMLQSFRPRNRPTDLSFVHGGDLIRVYSSITNDSMVLFEACDPGASAIACVDFAYVNRQWIVW